jgi:GDP-L-fucose synthase
MNDLDQKIYVAGSQGMVGSAIVRALKNKGYSNIIGASHEELDLTNQIATYQFFEKEKPHQVYLAAAKVGGIHANHIYPAEFIYTNLMIQSNVIHAAYKVGVKKLLFLGSSCIYPKLAEQPMGEEVLLSGHLEATNEPYAIGKIAGIKLCESYNRQFGVDFRSIMPTNLYGPGDNYHPENAHVIPALIKRFHEAKVNGNSPVTIWGSGKPRREFLYVDDMAEASVFVMELDQKKYQTQTETMRSHLNVGFGSDLTIQDLAMTIKKAIEFKGEIEFDLSKPDGPPQKLIDSSRLHQLGWKAKTCLESGLNKAYQDFLLQYA